MNGGLQIVSKHAVRKRPGGFATLGVAVTAAAVMASGTVMAAPAGAVSGPVSRAAQQCGVANGPSPSDAAAADAIMRGRVAIGSYGTYVLAANPTWGPQSGLDRSGNANVHGLTWLLPLLREGQRRGDPAMINRFYGLLADWRHDVRPQRLSSTGPYSALPEAQRLITLTCALAGPRGGEWWVQDFLNEQMALIVLPNHWQAVNNTSLQQATSLWAAGYTLASTAVQRIALARIDQISRRLLLPDGSDREGSLQYAAYNYQLFGQTAQRLRIAGTPVPASVLAYQRIPLLLAAATRPDGMLEALGDGVPARAPLLAGTPVEYAASRGTQGAAPDQLLSRWLGGYIFDRSGWGTGDRPFTDETFWSLRTGGASALAIHGHADAGALTLASHGSQLLFDSGLYRYVNSAGRRYVVSRPAHTAVSLAGVPYRRSYGVQTVAQQSTADGDLVTLTDPGYAAYWLARTVYYDRAGDYLVVWDSSVARPTKDARLAASQRKQHAQQNWQLGADRSVTTGPGTAATDGPGANVSFRWIGSAPALSVTKGRAWPSWLGWNSSAYGSLAPAPTLSADLPAGGSNWVTVIFPRAAGVGDQDVSATGTVGPAGADLTVRTGSVTQQLHLTRSSAVRTDVG